MDIFDLVEGPETARMVHFVMEAVNETEDISALKMEDFPPIVVLPILRPDPEYTCRFAQAIMIAHIEHMCPNMPEFEINGYDIETISIALLEGAFDMLRKHVLNMDLPLTFGNPLGQVLKEWSDRHIPYLKEKYPVEDEPLKKKAKKKKRPDFVLIIQENIKSE